MRVIQRKRYGSLCLAPASPNLANIVLEALRQVDPRTMRVTGDRVADRFSARLDPTRNGHSRAATVDIDLEIDLRENRFVHLVEGCRKDLEKVAPGSVSRPLMMRNNDSRCSGVARSSTIGTTCPPPS